MAENQLNGYRFYYDKDIEFLIQEELINLKMWYAERRAKARLRMYANLFCRDMRKKLISKNSSCVLCLQKENLQIDHIIPVSRGGKNSEENTQILCGKCNILKSNRP